MMNDPIPCGTCDGTGTIEELCDCAGAGWNDSGERCEECDGEGYYFVTCDICRGLGYTEAA